jgi:iron-sulfur cluster repair protein YtfE (RIC family)
MAATIYVCAIAQVADELGEDTELLEAIVSNDDNLTYCHCAINSWTRAYSRRNLRFLCP